MICIICQENIVSKISFNTLVKVNCHPFCQSCMKQLEPVTSGCIQCGKKEVKGTCDECLYWARVGLGCKHHACFYYNDFAREILKSIKFSGNKQLCDAFSLITKQFLLAKFSKKKHMVLPVPIHIDRLAERGFNQALSLCQQLPYDRLEGFEKVNSEQQSKRKKKERMLASNDYAYTNKQISTNKRVIIIDDIYTTGSTIKQISKLLKENGVTSVVSFSLFRS